jgi:diguanylate cyclase
MQAPPKLGTLKRVESRFEDPRPSMSPRFSASRAGAFGGIVALAAVYVVTARLSVLLASTGSSPAAVWAPTGVALAALIRFGPRWWPGVLVGSLVANLVVGLPSLAGLLIAVGNTLDALIGVWGTRRYAGDRANFGRTRYVLAYIGFGVVLGPALSATFGVLGLRLAGVLVDSADQLAGWVTWFVADGFGVLIVGPFLLLAASTRRLDWRGSGKRLEMLVELVGLAVIGWLVLAGEGDRPLHEPYLVLPFMLWVVLRLGSSGAIVANVVLFVLATWAVEHRQGPFLLDTPPASLLWMQSFSAVSSVTALLLAAALHEARSEGYRASHDPLTGIANRFLVETTLQEAVGTARRNGVDFALLVADLDRFKEINDTFGHRTGDLVLQAVAERWRSAIRPGDTLGRLAGDEFAVVLPGADAEVGAAVARRLVLALNEPISVDGQRLSVGASVGLATYPSDGTRVDSLLQHADGAMYAAKRRAGAPRPTAGG